MDGHADGRLNQDEFVEGLVEMMAPWEHDQFVKLMMEYQSVAR